MKIAIAIACNVAASFVFAVSAPADGDFVVSDCGDSGGPDQLRAKIVEANVALGGTITFTCGPATITVASALPNITSEITIDGGGDITLSGGNTSPILNSFAPLHLLDLTLEKGRAAGNGGAVYTSNSSLSTNGVVFQNNVAVNDGGGLYVNNSTVLLDDTRFVENQAGGDGGGAYNFKGTVTLINVDFDGNEATGYSGALSNDSGQVTWTGGSITGNSALNAGAIDSFDRGLEPAPKTEINHVRVFDNEASHNAGAFYVFAGASLIVADSTLEANDAVTDGGAVYNAGNTLLERVLLRSNTAGSSGGGITSDAGFASVISSTLFDNSAPLGASVANGEGLAFLTNVTVVGGDASVTASLFQYFGGSIELVNTILDKGLLPANCAVAEEEPGTIQSEGFNVSDDDSCIPYLTKPTDGASVDAQLGPIGDHGGPTESLVPEPGSEMVDAGGNALCPDTDQRGVSRPQGEACDIGAVEVVACEPVPLCGDATGDHSVTAPDALAALRTSVGSATCDLWLCDYNGSGSVTAADALAILRRAVGQPTTPACPVPWDCF